MVKVARKADATPIVPVKLMSEIQAFVETHQSELVVSTLNGFVVLDGKLTITGPKGPFDVYQIYMGVPANFPLSEPVVFETGGRVPRIADRHVFVDGKNCCLGVWEEWLLTPGDHSFSGFMRGPLNDYFMSQSWYEVHTEWPFGQRSHGKLGILEAYCSLLEIDLHLQSALSYLNLLARKQIKGHQLCPCGSGQRLRSCHSEKVHGLQNRISPEMAGQMLRGLVAK